MLFFVAATGKSIPADEINYVPSLDIETINMNHITTTLIQNPSAEMMADSNDALTIVKQQPQSSTELRTDVSESEDNVAATLASPSNRNLKSAILDLLPSYHEPVCLCSELLIIHVQDPNSFEALTKKNSFEVLTKTEMIWLQDETGGMDRNEIGSMSERSPSSSDVADNDGNC